MNIWASQVGLLKLLRSLEGGTRVQQNNNWLLCSSSFTKLGYARLGYGRYESSSRLHKIFKKLNLSQFSDLIHLRNIGSGETSRLCCIELNSY
jgi:hypothetical protein